MANEEHLAILRQGVEAWNEWRNKEKAIKPELTKANLNGAFLRGADLSKADLSGAFLRGADISGADLRQAKLIGAKLVKAHINEVSFVEAILRGVDLRQARLIGADLRRADLCGADLIRTNLREADLSKADLSGADLQEALLQTARLLNANLDGANLTDSRLWETQCAGWSVKGAICESVYWDYEAKEKTTYSAGEFERLFADQTRIKLFYKDGISPLEILTLPSLIQHLEESHPGARLRFVSIKEDSGGAVVELAIESEENSSPEQIKQLMAAIEKRHRREWSVKERYLLKERRGYSYKAGLII